MKLSYSNLRSYIRKTFKYGFYIPWSNLLLTYGRSKLSESYKQQICANRNRIIQQVLQPVVDEASRQESLPMEEVPNAPIWVCWFQGEAKMPEIPKMCLASIRKNANGHPVILLTADNYAQYVQMPDIVLQRYRMGQLKSAHFADILRIHLLAQRGGIWLDATLLLTRPLPEEVFSMPLFTIKTKPFGCFVSQCRWAVFCLASWKHNPLFVKLAKAFELYLKETDVFVDYFMFDQFVDMLYQRDETIREMLDAVPFNNEHVHQLGRVLDKPYRSDHWTQMSQDTYLFKLSWKTFQGDALNAISDSYYAYFKQQFQ